MNLLNELRHTCKVPLKHYWFTLLCASVLAIGLGIVLPMYSLTFNLALQTPDFPDGDRFVALRKEPAAGTARGMTSFDGFHYRYFKDNSRSFPGLYAWRNLSFALSDGDYNEVFASAEVEPALMQVPQVPPEQGRLFNDDDVQLGASPVAIVSHEVWQSYYAGRDDIIGLSSSINGQTRTIVGVMPPGFRFPLVQESSLDAGQQGTPVIYRPVTQAITPTIQAITRLNSMQLTPGALFRDAANKVDRAVPVASPMTLRDLEIRSADGEQVNRNIAIALMFIALYVTGSALGSVRTRAASVTDLGDRPVLVVTRQIFVPDAGHAIPRTHPQVVVEAVNDVVEHLRKHGTPG